MSFRFRDFIKPIIFSENRHYLGKELHMRQFLVYVAIIAGFTFIIFAMWDFDVWVLVAGWVAVSFSVVAYHTTDRIADHIHYHTWSKYLGAERPDSKPELHAAIKNYEKHPTEKNRARVIDLASNDKKIN